MAEAINFGLLTADNPNSLANRQAKELALSNAQQANQLGAMQLSEARNTAQQSQGLRNTLAGFTPTTTAEDQVNALMRGGHIKEAQALLESQFKINTARQQNEEFKSKTLDAKLKRSRAFLDTLNPSDPSAPARYIAWHEANHADPDIGPELAKYGITAEQSKADINAAIQKGPQAFADLVNRSKLGTEKFMEMNAPKPVAAGASLMTPTGAVLGTAPNKPVMDKVSPLARLEAELADIVAANPNDPRIKDYKNGIAKLTQFAPPTPVATGPTFSPTQQTLDFAAQTYIQTGQMPSLGSGKAGQTFKQQILQRAAEMQMGGGATPAEAAGGVVSNKIDAAVKTKANKDFSTGVQGKQVTAFNTAIDHLATMDKLSDALQNGDTKAINYLGNVVAQQTGAPAPTNFNAAKQIVTSEIIKAVVASGGGVTERQEAERNFSSANSPAQLKGLIQTYKKLLGGQLNSLNVQYENTTGKKDFTKKLTPDAKTELNAVRGNSAPANMSPQDKQALDWANSNPKDPRAAKIKQRLGL